jgi:hypothetical protein
MDLVLTEGGDMMRMGGKGEQVQDCFVARG